MITAWLAKLWAKVCTWLAFAGAVVLAIVSVGLYERKQGAKQQADTDKAKDAQERADAAHAAQQVHTNATKAAAQVQQDAAKQPAPNPDKRDDLNSTF